MSKRQKNFKYEKGCNEEDLKKIKKTEKESKASNGKILVSQFAYQKAKEKKELLEKDVIENVAESNKDYPESDAAFVAANQLKTLKKLMESFCCVERHNKSDVIQLGDEIVFKHGEKEIRRIADGYIYNSNVCTCLTDLVDKSRGDKVTIGKMSNVEIIDFYPPK